MGQWEAPLSEASDILTGEGGSGDCCGEKETQTLLVHVRWRNKMVWQKETLSSVPLGPKTFGFYFQHVRDKNVTTVKG
jgi:hypothetical protein